MTTSRRDFLKTGAVVSGAFVIGFYIPPKAKAAVKQEKALEPNAFVEIKEDNTINFIMGQVEMGQGTYTTLAMCIAEELNVKWEDVNFKGAQVNPVYNHFYGPFMITGGSTSIVAKQLEMRKIGASINEMLKKAAAKKWQVRSFNTYTKNSKVYNKLNKKSFTFGELVADLATMEVPKDPKIKDLSQCKLIGKPIKRHPKEAWAKVTGKAEFGIDVRVPNLKYAAVLHPAVFGGKVKSFDGSKAEKRKGVLKVKQIPSGIAVIAEHWWIAKEALNDIKVVWDNGSFNKNSAELDIEYSEILKGKGAPARQDGNTEKAFKEAEKIVEAEFNFPFVAHAAMEPLGVTVHHEKDKATIWSSSQSQTFALGATAKVLGVAPQNIHYETPYLGSAFGRRGVISMDFVVDGLFVAKDEPYPIMTLWTREDDIKGGYYRPKYKNTAKVALDKDGDITAIEGKVAGQQMFKGTPFEVAIVNGVEPAQNEGLSTHPYSIDSNNFQIYSPESPITTLWLRSVGHTHTAPTIEGIIDQAAYAAGKDPIEFRINTLKDIRFIELLKDVAKKSGWANRKKEKNVGYGVAIVESFGSVCAQVAKVRVTGNDFKVEKVWASIDCGFAFNPLNVENQIIGAINFGIAMLKHSEITIEGGAAVESNFYDFQVSRQEDTPEVEVSIVNSNHKIGGIGEPGVPPILAAVPNALFDATGKRFNDMPIKLG